MSELLPPICSPRFLSHATSGGRHEDNKYDPEPNVALLGISRTGSSKSVMPCSFAVSIIASLFKPEKVVTPRSQLQIGARRKHLIALSLVGHLSKHVRQFPRCACQFCPWNSNAGRQGQFASIYRDQND